MAVEAIDKYKNTTPYGMDTRWAPSLIRAIQGHSIKFIKTERTGIRLNADTIKGIPCMCHGTKMSVIAEIMSSGLLMSSPMDVAMDEGSADVDEVNPGSAGGIKTGRNCVHFSPFARWDLRCLSGMRKENGVDCQISVDIEGLIDDDVPIILTSSGALMVEGNVPTRYIEVIMREIRIKGKLDWVKVYDRKLAMTTLEAFSPVDKIQPAFDEYDTEDIRTGDFLLPDDVDRSMPFRLEDNNTPDDDTVWGKKMQEGEGMQIMCKVCSVNGVNTRLLHGSPKCVVCKATLRYGRWSLYKKEKNDKEEDEEKYTLNPEYKKWKSRLSKPRPQGAAAPRSKAVPSEEVNPKQRIDKKSGGQGDEYGGSATGKRSASGGQENETGGSATGKRSRSETSSASKQGSGSEPVPLKEIRRAMERNRNLEDLAEQILRAEKDEETPC